MQVAALTGLWRLPLSVAERCHLLWKTTTDDGVSHVAARFGYLEDPNVPKVLGLADSAGLESPLDLDQVSYFLSTIELHIGPDPGMARWRKRLSVDTSYITSDAAEYYGLPRKNTVLMGSIITV